MRSICLLFFVTSIVAQSVNYPDVKYQPNQYGQNPNYNNNNPNAYNGNNNNQQQPQGGFYNAASHLASQAAQRIYNNTLVNRVVRPKALMNNLSKNFR